VFGESPTGCLRDRTRFAIDGAARGPGEGERAIIDAVALDLGIGPKALTSDLAAEWTGPRPSELAPGPLWRTVADTRERLADHARKVLQGVVPAGAAAAPVVRAMAAAGRALDGSGEAEIAAVLAAVRGQAVAPGPSGAPTRGRPDTLPTGRNFFSVDSRAVPTPTAWALGWKSANLLIDKHLQIHGDWPRAMLLTAWGTANMRTGGDDIAQCLALMGVRPQWDAANRRVTGFEIIPATALGRPRVDVTLRVSGFFRDAFPAQMALFDAAARAVMALDEPADQNPAAARHRAEGASEKASWRVFGAKPGAYGAGLQAMIDARLWERRDELADAYLTWGGYAYGKAEGAPARGELAARLAAVDAVVQNQDNREHDLLDSDDYYQFEGGAAAAVEHLRGKAPTIYHNDHSRPERPIVRTLEDEIGRIVRARVVNPKWLAGVMRHGYKGAFEIAASVDYLFAFAATTNAVRSHHFDLVHRAVIEDDAVRRFIDEANPAALREIAERLIEAMDRGFWQPRSNSARAFLETLG